ncbi:MAG: amidohydrolase family protein [Bacteroidota bacterium]|nr:amidohydrolase family protein [Bacteroidota bacterium]
MKLFNTPATLKRTFFYSMVIFAIIGITSLIPSCLIHKIGGASQELPSRIQQNLSSGAALLIRQSLVGIDSIGLQDYHTHIAGTGVNGSGNYVNADMLSWFHFIKHFKFKVYMSGSGIKHIDKADPEFIERLADLIKNIPQHGKFCILAFDQYYNSEGVPDSSKTEFYVPNEYVFSLAKNFPDLFVPVISVHPYRNDALFELEKWALQGGQMVKWLPNAMGIDPSNEKCTAFYQKMKSLNLVLLTHAGEEKAVDSKDDQKYGNPLLLRKPLDAGVKVIVAHCASLGEGIDTDNGGIMKPNFDLFMRMMQDKKYEGLLFGDISALTQDNRSGRPLQTLLEHTELHHRLVNGSDYPLPAINVIIRTKKLVKSGYITEAERTCLNEIYDFNPLLFDFVLKRTIKSQNKKQFPPALFMKNISLGM